MFGFFALGAMNLMSAAAKRRRETFRKLRISKAKEMQAKDDLTRYSNLFTQTSASNPYSNLTNPFADLKLDLTKQAEFGRDQFQQGQANTLRGIAGSSGTSGMANKVKLLSQMGIDAAQKSASSIQNINPYSAQAAAKIDHLKRTGRNVSAMFEADKFATLMDMERAKRSGYEDDIKRQEGSKEKRKQYMQSLMSSMMSMGGSSGEGGFGNVPGPDPNTSALIQNQPWYSGGGYGGGMPGVSIS